MKEIKLLGKEMKHVFDSGSQPHGFEVENDKHDGGDNAGLRVAVANCLRVIAMAVIA